MAINKKAEEGESGQLENEKEVISQAKNGDLLAFEKLLFLYEKRIFNYLYRILGNRYDTEDATQDVFIKAYKNLSRFDMEREFSPWIYKIATNTAYDCLRKRRARPEILIGKEGEQIETIEDTNPYYKEKEMEYVRDFETALARLKPAYRTALKLYYRDDLDYKHIAQTLEIPLNTVKTHLRRARKELFKFMQDTKQ